MSSAPLARNTKSHSLQFGSVHQVFINNEGPVYHSIRTQHHSVGIFGAVSGSQITTPRALPSPNPAYHHHPHSERPIKLITPADSETAFRGAQGNPLVLLHPPTEEGGDRQFVSSLHESSSVSSESEESNFLTDYGSICEEDAEVEQQQILTTDTMPSRRNSRSTLGAEESVTVIFHTDPGYIPRISHWFHPGRVIGVAADGRDEHISSRTLIIIAKSQEGALQCLSLDRIPDLSGREEEAFYRTHIRTVDHHHTQPPARSSTPQAIGIVMAEGRELREDCFVNCEQVWTIRNGVQLTDIGVISESDLLRLLEAHWDIYRKMLARVQDYLRVSPPTSRKSRSEEKVQQQQW